MTAHGLIPRDRYQLRNDSSQTFALTSSASGEGQSGCTVRVVVVRHDGHRFRMEVVFDGEYSASKANFTSDMYLDTALSLVRSQIESRVHRDTRIHLNVNSGLPITEVDAKFEWQEP